MLPLLKSSSAKTLAASVARRHDHFWPTAPLDAQNYRFRLGGITFPHRPDELGPDRKPLLIVIWGPDGVGKSSPAWVSLLGSLECRPCIWTCI